MVFLSPASSNSFRACTSTSRTRTSLSNTWSIATQMATTFLFNCSMKSPEISKRAFLQRRCLEKLKLLLLSLSMSLSTSKNFMTEFSGNWENLEVRIRLGNRFRWPMKNSRNLWKKASKTNWLIFWKNNHIWLIWIKVKISNWTIPRKKRKRTRRRFLYMSNLVKSPVNYSAPLLKRTRRPGDFYATSHDQRRKTSLNGSNKTWERLRRALLKDNWIEWLMTFWNSKSNKWVLPWKVILSFMVNRSCFMVSLDIFLAWFSWDGELKEWKWLQRNCQSFWPFLLRFSNFLMHSLEKRSRTQKHIFGPTYLVKSSRYASLSPCSS